MDISLTRGALVTMGSGPNTVADPLIHTPHLIGAAHLVLPTNPLHLEIAAAQAVRTTIVRAPNQYRTY